MLIVLAYTLGIIVIIPLLTFLHELGHIIIPLIVTDKDVTILLGGNSFNGRKFEFRRMKLIFSGWFLAGGFAFWEGEIKSKILRVLCSLGGPLVSFFLFILFYRLSVLTSNKDLYTFYRFFGTFAFYSLVSSIVPMKYRFFKMYDGIKSDGRRILDIISEK